MTAAAERGYAKLVSAFATDNAVTPPDPGTRGFGRTALRVDGRIFAFLKPHGLVLKLPAERVAALIASKRGVPFTANKPGKRPMTEWVVVKPARDWLALAKQARAFVSPPNRGTRAASRR
ncbi:MAG TPA: hypothetical protein VGG28_14190 [Kofleriaceae bacterium]